MGAPGLQDCVLTQKYERRGPLRRNAVRRIRVLWLGWRTLRSPFRLGSRGLWRICWGDSEISLKPGFLAQDQARYTHVDAVLVRFVIIGLGNCRFGLGLGQLFAELLVWASDSSPWPDMISIDFGEGLVDTPLLTVACCKPHSEVASEQGCCLVWGNLDNGNPLDKCAPYAVGSKLAELPWSLL